MSQVRRIIGRALIWLSEALERVAWWVDRLRLWMGV